MRAWVRGAWWGLVAFVATTVATVATTTLAAGGHPAVSLPPLDPDPAHGCPASSVAGISRSSLDLPVEGGRTRALLVEPEGGASVGVVLVPGAGPSDREDGLAVAETLARRGVAALTYDKRTEGYSPLRRDFTVLADDALAAVEALRDATTVERVGAWGVSEGSWVVMEAAARPQTSLAFAVLASAPVVSPAEQAAWVVDGRLRTAPGPIRLVATGVIGQGRSFLGYLDFDSRPRLRATGIPVMAVWGAQDAVVPVNEAYRRLDDGLDGDLTARIVPGLGHDVQAEVGTWAGCVAAWMREPVAAGLVGVEPSSDLGAPRVPVALWYSDPRLHLVTALLAAVLLALAVTRGTPHDPRRDDEREPS